MPSIMAVSSRHSISICVGGGSDVTDLGGFAQVRCEGAQVGGVAQAADVGEAVFYGPSVPFLQHGRK
ncbi:hypothetical protein ASG92_24895 [Arthrobacter sp. Soil736]|nr:hypothetical protein ASG92_24895 [Arthrobacter sp. Soil736]